MKERFPRLHSFVIDDLLSVKDIFQLSDITDNLHLPLSTEAHQEFLQLQELFSTYIYLQMRMIFGGGLQSLESITLKSTRLCSSAYSGGPDLQMDLEVLLHSQD